jgi:pantoate kinase
MYFSGGSANFVTFGASTSVQVGSLTLDPGLQMSFVSQTVDVSLLPKNRGKGKGLVKQQGTPTTTTITGLSNFSVQVTASYPFGKGFALSVTPAYAYSPTDLAARTSQFLWSAAISYSADF